MQSDKKLLLTRIMQTVKTLTRLLLGSVTAQFAIPSAPFAHFFLQIDLLVIYFRVNTANILDVQKLKTFMVVSQE